jgi:hypothetical protein
MIRMRSFRAPAVEPPSDLDYRCGFSRPQLPDKDLRNSSVVNER